MSDSASLLYFVMHSVIVSRQIYDPIYEDHRTWRGIEVCECVHPQVYRCLQKVAAMIRRYMKICPNLRLALVIYDQALTPVEKWQLDCMRLHLSL